LIAHARARKSSARAGSGARPWVASATRIPHLPIPATAIAYIEDVDTLTWCHLPWIDRAPLYQRDKTTFIAVVQRVGDKLLVWLDGQAAGYLATFQ
jgi:hypothetical protein